MAAALHYHMFQMVVVANSGQYGGSNAYAPYKEQFKRQVFHLHGQPQASVAFFEIDDIAGFIQRVGDARAASMPDASGETPTQKCKCPPAGIEDRSGGSAGDELSLDSERQATPADP